MIETAFSMQVKQISFVSFSLTFLLANLTHQGLCFTADYMKSALPPQSFYHTAFYGNIFYILISATIDMIRYDVEANNLFYTHFDAAVADMTYS